MCYKNVNKVLYKGRKYPQNSLPPFSYIFIVIFSHNYHFNFFDFKHVHLNFTRIIATISSVYLYLRCRVLEIAAGNHSLLISVNNLDFFVNDSEIIYLHKRSSKTVKTLKNFKYFDAKGVITVVRIITCKEIKINLLRGGIESNPGPSLFDIISVNCNGLTSDLRLLQTIGAIKKRAKNVPIIVLLQETHLANITLIENIWTGPVFVSPGTGGSRGVITLCSSDFKAITFKADTDGRTLFVRLDCGNNNQVVVANVYSPNDHVISKKFIQKTFESWDSFITESQGLNPGKNYHIFAGDLNCVLHQQDMQNRLWSLKERDLASTILEETSRRSLLDTVARSNKGNNYTWNRGNLFSKIDYIFCCNNLFDVINEYNTIWDYVRSDHAAIQAKVNLNATTSHGRSYPKLNSTDISNTVDKEALRKEIAFNILNFPSHWNPHQRLDFIKVIIRTKVLEIRSTNKRKDSDLDKLQSELEALSEKSCLSNEEAEKFNSLRMEIYQLTERQAEKLRITAGIKWREEGERSTKYFLNAIKINRAISNMDSLVTEYGTLMNNVDLLNYTKKFYTDLYQEQTTSEIPNFYQHCPKLIPSANNELNKDLTLEELVLTLKSCKDSSPGLDGIPYSYYKAFKHLLLPLVLDSWKYSLDVGKLPDSQAVSCITVIPKQGKDKTLLKNWRPISVSPCDLKIITKALSNRVDKHLANIISESQMGYVVGRDINFNNRLLNAALNYCKNNDLDYILTSLDAQKAYDSVDHKFITKTLKVYGFPDGFIKSVDLLHSNLKALVQVNGHLSSTFDIKRGVKQGDSLSCALFIVAIDPLIRNIENNTNIPPLLLNSACRLKTFAYADDIAVITANDDVATLEVFNEYMKLTVASGLTLNADKTEIINLSATGKEATIANYNNSQLTIPHVKQVTICGNHLSLDEKLRYEVNIKGKISKLETQLKKWKGRNLTINGKMIILKTFAISQLIFSSQSHLIPKKDLRRIETICYDFVWNGNDRVKRGILKSGRDEGGINGIDVESFFGTIAVRQFLKSYNNPMLKLINDDPIIEESIKVTARHIIRRVLLNQLKLFDSTDPADVEWLLNTPVHYLVKQGSKIDCLIHSLSIERIGSIAFSSMNRGTANKIRRALPCEVLTLIDSTDNHLQGENQLVVKLDGKLYCGTKITSKVLNKLLKKYFNKVINYHPADKYIIERSLFKDIRISWTNLWQVKNPTLRAIRHKVLLKDIWSNEKRHRLGITHSSKCEFCGDIEDVKHQLFNCHNASRMWLIYNEITGDNINIQTDESFIRLIEVDNDISNELVKAVIFKLLIQINRSSNLSLLQIKTNILHWLIIEKAVLRKNLHTNKVLLRKLDCIIDKLNNYS